MTTDDKYIQVIIYKVNILNKSAVFPQFICTNKNMLSIHIQNFTHLYIDKVSKKTEICIRKHTFYITLTI